MAARDAPNVLDRLFWHVNMEALLRTGDYLLIHSGSVVTPEGAGVLIPGASGSGKTSLATALVAAGFGFLSDEAGAIDPVTGRLFPYRRAIALKSGAFTEFKALRPKRIPAFAPKSQWYLQPDDIRPGSAAQPSHVGFVFLSRFEKGQPTTLTEIGRAEAVVELMKNCVNISTYRGRAVAVLANALRRARCYRLVRGALDEGVRAVLQTTRAPAPGT
jgi:hypothetical protein